MNLSMKNEAKHQNVKTTEISVIPEISVAFEADSSFLELLFRKFFLQIFYFFQIVPISLMFYDDKRSEVTKAEQKLRRKLDIPHVI